MQCRQKVQSADNSHKKCRERYGRCMSRDLSIAVCSLARRAALSSPLHSPGALALLFESNSRFFQSFFVSLQKYFGAIPSNSFFHRNNDSNVFAIRALKVIKTTQIHGYI